MYYKRALNKTISYIEKNLCEPITLDDLTIINGFSRWHFSRLFHLFTGYSISEYIRCRRLTEAAFELTNTTNSIIDIALNYQFSSQETFTRIFKKYYGMPPGQFRKIGRTQFLINPLDVNKLVWEQGGLEMKPEIIELEPFHVVGLVYSGTNGEDEIGQLWGQLTNYLMQLPPVEKTRPCYGICQPFVNHIEDLDLETLNKFHYMAGIQLEKDMPIEQGMEVWDITHNRYAVFTHVGSVHSMMDTCRSIYSKWLPESGYEAAYAPELELYNHNFKPGEDDSKIYIYIPVK